VTVLSDVVFTFFNSVVVLTLNGNFLVVPLLHSVSDHGCRPSVPLTPAGHPGIRQTESICVVWTFYYVHSLCSREEIQLRRDIL